MGLRCGPGVSAYPAASLTTGESFGLNKSGVGGWTGILAWRAASQGGILESASQGEAGRMVGKKMS